MKHTTKLGLGLSFVVEDRGDVVRVDLVTPFMTKGFDLTPDTAGAIAAALVISAEKVERNASQAHMQRLVNNAEGLVK